MGHGTSWKDKLTVTVACLYERKALAAYAERAIRFYSSLPPTATRDFKALACVHELVGSRWLRPKSGLGKGSAETVTHSPHRFYQVFVASRLKGLPQPADMHVYGALFDKDAISPDLVEQLRATINPFRMRHKKVQHAKFDVPELDVVARARNTPCRGIDFDSGDLDNFSR
jgi:hypothetical protein